MIISPLNLFRLLLFLLIAQSAFAQKIKLVSYKIPDYVLSKDQGTFITLAKDILKESKYSYDIELFPPKRAVLNFELGKVDGYFPSLDVLNKGAVQKTEPFYYKRDYLFSLREMPKDLLRSNKKLKICVTNGYPYDIKKLKVKYELLKSASDEVCFEILKKKRADYFLCELHTGITAAQNTGVRNYFIHPEPISILSAYFAFQNNPRGKELATSFSEVIKKMKKDGRLSKYFSSSVERIKKVVNFGYDPTTRD